MRMHDFLPRLLTLALLTTASVGVAMEPPTPEQVAQYRKDGSFAARVAAAKAIGNHRVAERLVERSGQRLKELSQTQGAVFTPPSAWRGMPTTGTVKMLVLMIDFSDYPHTDSNTQETVNARIFGPGDSGTSFPLESLSNYYRRASFGKLELTGSVLGWYRPAYPRTQIPTSTTGRQTLIKEAINAFKAQGHDFAQYDNNNDGQIDYFAVLWAGPHTGWGSFWWGYQTDFYDPNFKIDGKSLGSYSWQWEGNYGSGAFNPLTLIHETGHALGLPDYYDYDAALGPKGGAGGYDMMDANKGDHNAFSKFLLDWMTPAVYTTGQAGVTLRSTTVQPEAAIVTPGITAGNPFGEYFLVQYRKKEGNDSAIPAEGLMIWHVDSRLNASGNNYAFDNSYAEHKLLRLMEADGLEEIEAGGKTNAGDFFVTGKQFGPATKPAAVTYDGIATWLSVTNIGTPGTTLSFDLVSVAPDTTAPTGAPTAPLDEGASTTQDRLAFTWTAGTAADAESGISAYHLQVGTSAGASDVFDALVGNRLNKTLEGLGVGGATHYARVRAMNAAGLYSAWSAASDGILLSLPALDCAALDACNLSFYTSGDAVWSSQAQVTHGTASAAVSGTLGHNQSSQFQTRILGPGTLKFWWKVSSEAGYDYLSVSVDGVTKPGAISGEKDWAQVSLALPAGAHAVKWTYAKDEGAVGGQDRAWVDQVEFSAQVAPSTFTAFSPLAGPVGSTVTLQGTNLNGVTAVTIGGATATYQVQSDTRITATVPAGAITGAIRLTTALGPVDGPQDFLVRSRDFNADGSADLLDLARLAKAFGARTGDTAYSAALDLNGDGAIDELDLPLFFLGM